MNTTAEQIKDRLLSMGKTVSTAESITAGHLQTKLTAVSGASDVFKGGITAYKLQVKVEALGVDKALAKRTDCVDIEVAWQMAAGALSLFKSDYALATCGYAEPYPDAGIEKPFAYYAIAQRTAACSSILWGDRIELLGLDRTGAQRHTAQTVLEKFLALLQKQPGV